MRSGFLHFLPGGKHLSANSRMSRGDGLRAHQWLLHRPWPKRAVRNVVDLIEGRQPRGAPHRGGTFSYIKNFMAYKHNLDIIDRSGMEAPKEWMIKRAKRAKNIVGGKRR
ncbi:hypothetical protein ACFLQ0_00480 [Nitrospinota bacterium]